MINRIGTHSLPPAKLPGHTDEGHKEGKDTFEERTAKPRSENHDEHREDQNPEKNNHQKVSFTEAEIASLCHKLNAHEFYASRGLSFHLEWENLLVVVKKDQISVLNKMSIQKLRDLEKSLAIQTSPKKGGLLNVSC
jgi:hypothetical protein